MHRALYTAIVAALIFALTPASALAQAWTHVRANRAGDGFLNVATAPALRPERVAPNLGVIGPGVSPVIGADGKVYVASSRLLHAFSADGRDLWARPVGPTGVALASPVIDSQGFIYIASTGRQGDGENPWHSSLTKYSSTGELIWSKTLPTFSLYRTDWRGRAASAPAILSVGGREYVALQMYYPLANNPTVRLVALTTNGDVAINHEIWLDPAQAVSGEWGFDFCDYYPFCMNKLFGLEGELGTDLKTLANLPHLAQYASGISSPIVVSADTLGHISGFRVGLGPNVTQSFRTNLLAGAPIYFQNPLHMSSPALLRGGQSATVIATRTESFLWIAGPGHVNQNRVRVPRSYAGPTVTAAGDIIVVNEEAGFSRIRLVPRGEVTQFPVLGKSYAPAAASRTHLYIATDSTLTTVNVRTFEREGVYQWEKGGFWGASIGPSGRVYAIANDSLYVFAPPPCRTLRCRDDNQAPRPEAPVAPPVER